MELLLGELKGQMNGMSESLRRIEANFATHIDAEEKLMAKIEERVISLEGQSRESKGMWKGLTAVGLGSGGIVHLLHRLFDK